MIKRITGSNSKIVHIHPRPGEVQCLRANITRAKSLGFQCETSFRDHLERYIDWYAKILTKNR